MVAGTTGQVLDGDQTDMNSRGSTKRKRDMDDVVSSQAQPWPENEGPTATDRAREAGIVRLHEMEARVHIPASCQPTRDIPSHRNSELAVAAEIGTQSQASGGHAQADEDR